MSHGIRHLCEARGENIQHFPVLQSPVNHEINDASPVFHFFDSSKPDADEDVELKEEEGCGM